jgi:hypothetical protein
MEFDVMDLKGQRLVSPSQPRLGRRRSAITGRSDHCRKVIPDPVIARSVLLAI